MIVCVFALNFPSFVIISSVYNIGFLNKTQTINSTLYNLSLPNQGKFNLILNVKYTNTSYNSQGNYATVGSAIVAIAIVRSGGWAGPGEQAFRPQWQFEFQAHFDKWFGLPQCLKTYHLSLYNIKKDMLLTGPFAMLSMPSFDFHLPPCTEGFLIHLSPLWQLPLFPSVAQFPCVYN